MSIEVDLINNRSYFLKRVVNVFKREGLDGVNRRVSALIRLKLAQLTLQISELFDWQVVRSAYGLKLKANYGDMTFRYYVLGGYGYFYSTLLKNIDQKFYFFDIGANQGLYSILAGKNMNCMEVTAFEPVIKTADIFLKNIQLNGLSNKVNLVNKAISEDNAIVKIAINQNHSGASTIAKGNKSVTDTTEEIATMNHEALNAVYLEDDIPIFVKIDVEGHEEVVITELFKSRFGDKIVQIFYECDEAWVSAISIAETLAKNGFELKKIGSGTHYDVLATRQITHP